MLFIKGQTAIFIAMYLQPVGFFVVISEYESDNKLYTDFI